MKLVDNTLIRGALAGAIATIPMTIAMARLFQSLPENQKVRPLPPGEITANAESAVGIQPNRKTHEALTSASHFAYGAACGVIYNLLSERIRINQRMKGPMFGLAVWGISYFGVLPALNLHPPATRLSKEKNAIMIVAHLIWGRTLAHLARQQTGALVRTAATGVFGQGLTARWVQRALA